MEKIVISVSTVALIFLLTATADRAVKAGSSLDYGFERGEWGISFDHSEEDGILTIEHVDEGKTYNLQIASKRRMGLLVELKGDRYEYSLRFLEEDQKWPAEELVEEKNVTSKSVTKLPGWVICIVVRENEYGV